MLISIIIPTRNRPEYVQLLIEDIQKQDVSNYEIIVVDQSNNPQPLINCKHICTNSLGPCISRNIGARIAKGEILVFLDDDARINPDFIREITTPIIHDRFDVVSGAICSPEGDYLRTEEAFLTAQTENFIKAITSSPDASRSRICLAFAAGSSAIKKTVFEQVNGFEESFDPTGAGEDRDMALKLYKNGYAIWYNAKAKLLHTIATKGGTRDVGSRSMMLDIHSYWMCQKYFSKKLSRELKCTIIGKYKRNFYGSLYTLKHTRTKFRTWRHVIRMLNK